jgi:hypothetical protein
MSFDKLMGEIDRIYQLPRCTKKNNCRHQVFSFNAFRGTGRYWCSRTPNMANCIKINGDEECDLYEEKVCSSHIVK